MQFDQTTGTQRVVFGRGSRLTRLAPLVDELGWRSIAVLTGRSHDVGTIVAALGDRVRLVFDEVRQHVPSAMVDTLLSRVNPADFDGLIAVGGGSAVGAAKAVALDTGLPILAIPTTYAGSEVTPVWGRTVDGVKRTGRDPRVLPQVVLYDPDLLDDLPRELAVTSALNALAHCVDGYWAAGSTPLSDALAAEASSRIHDGLTRLQDAGTVPSPEATDELLVGAYLAGGSFAITGSGLHHKICHALGGAFDLPHAPLHAVMLPIVTAFTVEAAPAAGERIARSLRSPSAGDGLQALYRAVNAPTSLTQIGFAVENRDQALDVLTALLPISSPRPVTPEAMAGMLDAALVGRAERS
ncbi:maleylacetate reductase [Herbiconiux ginsengi]|uniref:Maleylacetate reductase n=1 Tax=Herbiconiux ginsengi TaxID=381665 RepID=A0A1H3LMK2_9MICO|nr:maleylacetate reductase [Herbiconiux ginsengi]SDY65641.1 maleylacetate reductase [Herbiconiux ginsengi]